LKSGTILWRANKKVLPDHIKQLLYVCSKYNREVHINTGPLSCMLKGKTSQYSKEDILKIVKDKALVKMNNSVTEVNKFNGPCYGKYLDIIDAYDYSYLEKVTKDDEVMDFGNIFYILFSYLTRC